MRVVRGVMSHEKTTVSTVYEFRFRKSYRKGAAIPQRPRNESVTSSQPGRKTEKIREGLWREKERETKKVRIKIERKTRYI